MQAIGFPEVNVVMGADQPEYNPLPAQVGHLPLEVDGKVIPVVALTSCFQLSPEEFAEVLKTGCIFITVLTYNQPLQPIHGTTLKPEFL